jgi:hypothetical protein
MEFKFTDTLNNQLKTTFAKLNCQWYTGYRSSAPTIREYKEIALKLAIDFGELGNENFEVINESANSDFYFEWFNCVWKLPLEYYDQKLLQLAIDIAVFRNVEPICWDKLKEILEKPEYNKPEYLDCVIINTVNRGRWGGNKSEDSLLILYTFLGNPVLRDDKSLRDKLLEMMKPNEHFKGILKTAIMGWFTGLDDQ